MMLLFAKILNLFFLIQLMNIINALSACVSITKQIVQLIPISIDLIKTDFNFVKPYSDNVLKNECELIELEEKLNVYNVQTNKTIDERLTDNDRDIQVMLIKLNEQYGEDYENRYKFMSLNERLEKLDEEIEQMFE